VLFKNHRLNHIAKDSLNTLSLSWEYDWRYGGHQIKDETVFKNFIVQMDLRCNNNKELDMQWFNVLKLDPELRRKLSDYRAEMAWVYENMSKFHILRNEILSLLNKEEPDMNKIEELEGLACQLELKVRTRDKFNRFRGEILL